jgi:hypothetical protein
MFGFMTYISSLAQGDILSYLRPVDGTQGKWTSGALDWMKKIEAELPRTCQESIQDGRTHASIIVWNASRVVQ